MGISHQSFLQRKVSAMPHLFLTGPSGAGKSTLLKEELARCGVKVSGFFTQRQISPAGETLGFLLLPWASSCSGAAVINIPSEDRAGHSRPLFPGAADSLFIWKTSQGRIFRPEVFASLGIQLLSAPAPFLCLDELGGGELLVPALRQRLYDLLETHPCCLGVLKTPASLSSMRTRVTLASGAEEELAQLYAYLESRRDCHILPVTADSREQARMSVRSFLQKAACP